MTFCALKCKIKITGDCYIICQEDNTMDNLRADIVEFIKALVTVLLGFFNGTDSELTEEQIKEIEDFVNFIFIL